MGQDVCFSPAPSACVQRLRPCRAVSAWSPATLGTGETWSVGQQCVLGGRVQRTATCDSTI